MTKLYMLVGLPGCGKSTYAKSIVEKEEAKIFSSDALRKELYGDESIQEDNSALFEELHKRIITCLKSRVSAIYDATNISSKRRRAFLSTIKRLDVEKIAILMATPYEECVRRNSLRERHVPEGVIKRMLKNFTVPCVQEGFDRIEVIYPEDFTPISSEAFIEEAKKIPHDNIHHTATIGEHMKNALLYLDDNYNFRDLPRYNLDVADTLMYATLLHDIGKPFCKEFKNGKGEATEDAHYYGHMQVGAYLTFLLDVPEELKIAIALLIQYHMEPYLSWKDSEKAKKKVIDFLGEDFVKLVEILHDCDAHAH